MGKVIARWPRCASTSPFSRRFLTPMIIQRVRAQNYSRPCFKWRWCSERTLFVHFAEYHGLLHIYNLRVCILSVGKIVSECYSNVNVYEAFNQKLPYLISVFISTISFKHLKLKFTLGLSDSRAIKLKLTNVYLMSPGRFRINKNLWHGVNAKEWIPRGNFRVLKFNGRSCRKVEYATLRTISQAERAYR